MKLQCAKCYQRGMSFVKYHEGYDAKYCGICGSWLEEICSDPDCDVCVGRPDRVNVQEGKWEDT